MTKFSLPSGESITVQSTTHGRNQATVYKASVILPEFEPPNDFHAIGVTPYDAAIVLTGYVAQRRHNRGRGVSSRQIVSAPPNAFYIVPAGTVRYFKELALALSRGDLVIYDPFDVEKTNRLRGTTRAIILDHNASINIFGMEMIEYLNERNGYAQVQP